MSDCADENSNCTVANDPDGLPAQCVGRWASEKHEIVQKLVEATAPARSRYDGTSPRGDFSSGGTGYIELFAGPGRARVRETEKFIDGSPLVALKAAAAKNPFTRPVLCDIAPVNVAALRARTARFGAEVIEGDCNKQIDEIVRNIPAYGYNLALIDPFAPSALKFDTLRRLAAIRRMDMIIHFPTGSMKRNWDHDYEELLGLPYKDWGVDREMMGPKAIPRLIAVLRRQLVALGYAEDEIHTPNIPAIKNGSNVILYHLIFVSKHSLGKKIWNSITQTQHGQRSLPF